MNDFKQQYLYTHTHNTWWNWFYMYTTDWEREGILIQSVMTKEQEMYFTTKFTVNHYYFTYLYYFKKVEWWKPCGEKLLSQAWRRRRSSSKRLLMVIPTAFLHHPPVYLRTVVVVCEKWNWCEKTLNGNCLRRYCVAIFTCNHFQFSCLLREPSLLCCLAHNKTFSISELKFSVCIPQNKPFYCLKIFYFWIWCQVWTSFFEKSKPAVCKMLILVLWNTYFGCIFR